MRNWLATTLAALLLATPPGSAGPLKPGQIPADATWVVHIDIEAGVGSTVGSFAVTNRQQWGTNPCDEFAAKTGIDPARDIRGVTIYGPTCDDKHAVAIIDATSATDAYLDKLRAEEKTFSRIQGDKHLIDTWMEHGSPRFGFVQKDGDSRLLMVSRDKARLEEAIALTQAPPGESKSLALAVRPQDGSFVFVSAVGVAPAAKAGQAAVVQKVQDLHLDLGETAGQLYGDLVIGTESDSDARHVLQMVQGAVTIWRLMAQKSPELAPLVDASACLKMTASDSRVRAGFTFDAAKAVDMLKAIGEARPAETKQEPQTSPTTNQGAHPNANAASR